MDLRRAAALADWVRGHRRVSQHLPVLLDRAGGVANGVLQLRAVALMWSC